MQTHNTWYIQKGKQGSHLKDMRAGKDSTLAVGVFDSTPTRWGPHMLSQTRLSSRCQCPLTVPASSSLVNYLSRILSDLWGSSNATGGGGGRLQVTRLIGTSLPPSLPPARPLPLSSSSCWGIVVTGVTVQSWRIDFRFWGSGWGFGGLSARRGAGLSVASGQWGRARSVGD